MIAPVRAGTHRLSLPLLFAACLIACSEPPRCEQGLCPTGMSCRASDGVCVDDDSASADRKPFFVGDYSVVPLTGLKQAWLGYSPEQKSLIWVEGEGEDQRTTYLAGPAAGDDNGPEGELSAAVASKSGVPHVAWLRSVDRTLWYATPVDGRWQRERVGSVPPKRAAGRLAIALLLERPAIAFEDAIDGGIGVALRGVDGTWVSEAVPAPRGDSKLGGALALSGSGAGLTLATYDAVAGDLVLASRTSDGWQSARFAGRTGSDEPGDAGLPVALARDLGGGLVVAWRDRGRNLVRVARSQGGAVVRRTVVDGAYDVPERGVQRRHIVGTALAAAVRPDGRIAVALQDASRARIVVAVEKSNGSFERFLMPDTGRPQLRPRLVAFVDGSLAVSWLDLEAKGGGGGRLSTWPLQVAVGTP